MKRYGNIRFTRRIVVTLCMLVFAVNFLIPLQYVKADASSTVTKEGSVWLSSDAFSWYHKQEMKYSATSDSAIYSFVAGTVSDETSMRTLYGIMSFGNISGEFHRYVDDKLDDGQSVNSSSVNGVNFKYYTASGLKTASCDIYFTYDKYIYDIDILKDVSTKFTKYINEGVISDGMQLDVGGSYKPKDKAYSEIGALDNVQMETYITNKKELINADENADLSKINQDKVIVYSSTSTTGIDLSKGGYKVQLYGSYAWQDKSGHIKSEDKGHKTFIKDWNAENNIKGLNRANYSWIDWKSANDKVESDKTDNAHKPNVFEKMTTYGNYQFEPIWYLRIVSKDNKYGAWVKLYNSSKKGKYTSETVDDNDVSVSDSDGGYSNSKDTSEITGTGDTPENTKNNDNVQKTEEKQDNKDIQDASGGSNSTFDKLEEFTKGIGDVPKMIADLFSFLPSWCLEVVAIGFALLMILIVVKFIRG